MSAAARKVFAKRRPGAKSNRWWFVWEVELAEEGAQLVAAETEEQALELVRTSWGCKPGDPCGEVELGCLPADDLDTIEQWLRCEDPAPAAAPPAPAPSGRVAITTFRGRR